jgi:protein SCO1/2
VLAEYMKAFGPQFVGLTGSAAEIKDVEKKYRVYAAKRPLENGGYGMDHSSVLYLMGPNGKLVSFYDEAISPDDLAKELRAKI